MGQKTSMALSTVNMQIIAPVKIEKYVQDNEVLLYVNVTITGQTLAKYSYDKLTKENGFG